MFPGSREECRRKWLIEWGVLIPAELTNPGRVQAIHDVPAIVFSAPADGRILSA